MQPLESIICTEGQGIQTLKHRQRTQAKKRSLLVAGPSLFDCNTCISTFPHKLSCQREMLIHIPQWCANKGPMTVIIACNVSTMPLMGLFRALSAPLPRTVHYITLILLAGVVYCTITHIYTSHCNFQLLLFFLLKNVSSTHRPSFTISWNGHPPGVPPSTTLSCEYECIDKLFEGLCNHCCLASLLVLEFK